ncbi:unnamed protein product [Musa hybrid cultivar]
MSSMIFIYLYCPQRDGSSLSSTVMLQADLQQSLFHFLPEANELVNLHCLLCKRSTTTRSHTMPTWKRSVELKLQA